VGFSEFYFIFWALWNALHITLARELQIFHHSPAAVLQSMSFWCLANTHCLPIPWALRVSFSGVDTCQNMLFKFDMMQRIRIKGPIN